MKLSPKQTDVSTGFLNRLQMNEHFWKWIVKFGTHLSATKFIGLVEKELNDAIISSKRSDVRNKRVKEKTAILLFFTRNKNSLEKYFEDYNNAK